MAGYQAGRGRAAVTKRGVIPLVSLDPTSGNEQQAMRPVLVMSPGVFNRLTKTPVTLPITNGGNVALTAGIAVPLTGADTQTTGAVRCGQPRSLDIVSRRGRKIESAPIFLVDEALAKLSTIFE